MPEEFQLIRIHHAQVSIPTGGEEKVREFYCGLLGLEEVPKPESLRAKGGLWLELGEMQVHFGAEDGVDRARTKAHLAYEVTDLEALRTRLVAHGITPLNGTRVPGLLRMEIRDPFGNRIEFLEVTGLE